jgi:hypothetical protein
VCSHPLLAATLGESISSVQSVLWNALNDCIAWNINKREWTCSTISAWARSRHFLAAMAICHEFVVSCRTYVYLLTYAKATVPWNALNECIAWNINKREWTCSTISAWARSRHFLAAMATCHEFCGNCRTNLYLFTRAKATFDRNVLNTIVIWAISDSDRESLTTSTRVQTHPLLATIAACHDFVTNYQVNLSSVTHANANDLGKVLDAILVGSIGDASWDFSTMLLQGHFHPLLVVMEACYDFVMNSSSWSIVVSIHS